MPGCTVNGLREQGGVVAWHFQEPDHFQFTARPEILSYHPFPRVSAATQQVYVFSKLLMTTEFLHVSKGIIGSNAGLSSSGAGFHLEQDVPICFFFQS